MRKQREQSFDPGSGAAQVLTEDRIAQPLTSCLEMMLVFHNPDLAKRQAAVKPINSPLHDPPGDRAPVGLAADHASQTRGHASQPHLNWRSSPAPTCERAA
jgi:hypothetical protein